MDSELPSVDAGPPTDLDQLRARVRADRRTVSAPLLVFGALVLVHALVLVLLGVATNSAGARHSVLFVFWPLAGAVAVLALGRQARRIAERDGVGGGPRSYRRLTVGYFVSLPLIVLLIVPVFIFGILGSLLWPAMMLAAVAARQRNRTLRWAAGAVALAGGVEFFLDLGAVNWVPLIVEVLAGVGLLVGSAAAARRHPATPLSHAAAL
jgi:hypothetical protein